MILGQPTKLQSQFRLTYNMILNLLRVEALRVEDMIKRSFSENRQQRLMPDQQKKVLEGERQLQALKIIEDTPENRDMRKYYRLSTQLTELNSEMMRSVSKHSFGSRAFSSGRVVVLRDGHFRDHLAVILKPTQSLSTREDGRLDETRSFLVLAFVPSLIRTGSGDLETDAVPPLWPPQIKLTNDLTYELRVVPISSIAMVTKHILSVDAYAIAESHRKSHMEQALTDFLALPISKAVLKTPRIQMIDHELNYTKLRALSFINLMLQRASYLTDLEKLLHVEEVEGFEERYLALHRENLLNQKLAILRTSLSEENLELLPDYGARVAVLKELKFIDERATVLLKGRVACEINSSHELILTEIILENILADYDAAEAVALLSSLVFQDKTDVEPVLTPSLQRGCEQLQQIADRVEAVALRHNVGEDSDRGRGPLNFGLVEIVWRWAQGMPFYQVTELSDIQEGTIVRTMTRLDESCREVRDAARIIGDATLGKKMESCQDLIKRDVIFVSSLYV